MPPPSLSIANTLGEFDPVSALNSLTNEADWIGLRFVSETHHHRSARNGRIESNQILQTQGAMLEALVQGQIAYAATSDLTHRGLTQAVRIATELARSTADQRRSDLSPRQRAAGIGRYESPSKVRLDQVRLDDFTGHLIEATHRLRVSDAIVTAVAEATLVESITHYVTSSGADLRQQHLLSYQNFGAIAAEGSETQQRSLNGPTARCLQSGLESFQWDELLDECERTGQEALALLEADNCPDETMDLILSPDQMLLQIHESIGHPLELDRILGDERNYAGWSFVKPEDFGSLQYGSPLMNIVFDPRLSGEFASYAFDDGGSPAEKEYLIREGRLLRGLGGLESQSRSGIPGVANFRSSGWNRAPIDRMANINLEPGSTPFEAMLSQVERGVFMQSNRSWSIDDYRNKFQFGCEYAQLIEEGRLTRVLKNPNYRGITLPFWHSLQAVGNFDTFRMYGTPYCGKGEPNQMIRVGHASPTCLFKNIEVFGGAR